MPDEPTTVDALIDACCRANWTYELSSHPERQTAGGRVQHWRHTATVRAPRHEATASDETGGKGIGGGGDDGDGRPRDARRAVISRYQDRRWTDAETGDALTDAEIVQLRDAFLDAAAAELAALADDLAPTDGEPAAFIDFAPASVAGWAARFLDRIGTLAVEGYATARGGLAAMAPRDWEALAGFVDRQAGHARDFIAAVRGGELSAAQIAARSALYASPEPWERGKAAQRGAPDLPGYPGETRCAGRCRCFWEVEETETAWRCFWRSARDDRTCQDCLDHADEWAPFIQTKG